MESRNNKKCVICNKRRSRGGSPLLLSRFPLDSDRCRMWVKNAGIEDLAYVPIEKLHQLKFVCGGHFTPESFNAKGTRLKNSAIPTLELSNPILPDEVLTEFPLHVKDSNKENLKTVLYDHSYCIPKKSNPVERVPLTTTTKQLNSTCLGAVDIPDSGISAKTTFEPLPSTSNAPEHMTYKPITHDDKNICHQDAQAEILVHSYKRPKKNIEMKDTSSTFTIKEKRLWRQLQNAKKTIRNIAKSRVNLDKLDSEVLTSLVKDVVQNNKKKSQGKRWTLANKIYALAIFKRSPKAYRYMQKLFTLPSTKTLQRILKNIPMEPGINKNIIDMLEAKASSMPKENKYCSLIFDEMALKKRIIYNEIADKVDGYVDYGEGENMGREKKIADHALVFMIQGAKHKYKQYIAHYFVEGTISTAKLAKIISDIIKKLKEIGFMVLTTVCDQGSTNIGALNMLKRNCGQGIDSNFFSVNNDKIFIIYDIPHLFKSLRNNFFKSGNMSFDGKIAQWRHLVVAEEHNRNFLNFKKLNSTIVNPTFKTKMRVKYAAHALSNTVAAILKMMAWKEVSDCNDTAFVIEQLDKLFDCTNGPSSLNDVKKGIRENVSTSSNHIESWTFYTDKLKTIKFITAENTILKNVKCVKGYQISIKSLNDIWEKLKNEGFKYMNLRQFNQDSLENLFGIIRQHSVTNRNPTITHFTAALKTSMVTGLKVPHSRSANCEADNNKHMLEYKDILKTNLKTTEIKINVQDSTDTEFYPVLSIPDPENLEQPIENLCSLENQPVVYVSGYLAAKLLQNSSCLICEECLSVKTPVDNDLYAYISLREWWHDKKSLVYPTIQLCTTVNEAKQFYHDHIADQIYMENVGKFIFLMLSTNCNFSWFKCQQHNKEIYDKMFKILSYLFLRKSCKIINDSFIKSENNFADKSKKAQQQSIEK